MRVVLDANVLIGFLLTRGETISNIVEHWISGDFTLLTSDEILTEYRQILSRFVEKGIVIEESARALLNEVVEESIIIPTTSLVNLSVDRKDNRYLACSKDGKAELFVTGDKKHLLSLKKFNKTRIVSPKEFVDLLRN